jgi:hypothetical protein
MATSVVHTKNAYYTHLKKNYDDTNEFRNDSIAISYNDVRMCVYLILYYLTCTYIQTDKNIKIKQKNMNRRILIYNF